MEYTTADVKRSILLLSNELIAVKEELTEIDSKLGDGDMGISMAKGGAALRMTVEQFESGQICDLLSQCALAFNQAAPSTMGTLLSGGLLALSKKCKEKQTLTDADIVLFPKTIAQAIADRGKAKLGDKTILDALIPYADTLDETYARTGNLQGSLQEAASSAQAGMERTKGMLARSGRAKWLGERNKEFPDGGAVLCCRLAYRITAG
jgi:phosphoenolpyruvate---glycerone phosphotransferase subunit DhaL